ncbi:MAG: lipopolysaccharide biosynthesis protein RfbH [Brevinema sp.]
MSEELKKQILSLVKEYTAQKFPAKTFVKGTSAVPISGKIFDHEEVCSLVESALEFNLTTHTFNALFEKQMREFLGVKHVLTCNSGSSANLIAFTALTSPLLKERAIKAGDEVISVAAGFPTTINPIIQNGCIPVFIDETLPTYNIDVSRLEEALSPKTKAVFIAHTLGNPFDLQTISEFCQKHNLWLIEDCCDALGGTFNGKMVGTFGHIATFSFYPAHHITMGEGGAVATSDPLLKKAMESIRDWGRDCWCAPGVDNTCHKRFDWTYDSLPDGYDHKYVYSHVGYNLKITDMQAAIAVAQMKKLPSFIEIRRRNFKLLSEQLADLQDYFILPEATKGSDPSWFGYLLTLKDGVPFTRNEITRYLDSKKIGTRLLFAGNVTKQPYMKGQNYRVVGNLTVTDKIMNDTFWIGLYQGITPEMVTYVVDSIKEFIKSKVK